MYNFEGDESTYGAGAMEEKFSNDIFVNSRPKSGRHFALSGGR